MDELIRFVEMNQEPLVEIMSAMELGHADEKLDCVMPDML